MVGGEVWGSLGWGLGGNVIDWEGMEDLGEGEGVSWTKADDVEDDVLDVVEDDGWLRSRDAGRSR